MEFYGGKLNHIWVDLFILDRIPASKAGAEWTRLLHKAIYGLAMGHRYHLDFGKYSLMHKIFVGGLASLGHLIPMKVIFAMQRAAALKDRKSRGKFWYYSNYPVSYTHLDVYKRQLHSLCFYPPSPLYSQQFLCGGGACRGHRPFSRDDSDRKSNLSGPLPPQIPGRDPGRGGGTYLPGRAWDPF